MVLTPQLLQAIKLLQMPNAELAAFIEAELERNPLLERADELPNFDPPAAGSETPAEAAATPELGDWATETLESDKSDAVALYKSRWISWSWFALGNEREERGRHGFVK